MGPDSTLVVTFWWLVAIAAVIFAVAIGPRIAHRTVLGGLARAGTSVLGSVTLVLAIFFSVNAQYGWYASWSDLATSFSGTAPKGATTTGGAQQVQRNNAADAAKNRSADKSYATERASFEASLHLKTNPGPGGQYIHVHIPGLSAAAGDASQAGDVLVWLPPSYTDPTQKNRTYPVIEAFHGIPGGNRDYRTPFGASENVGGAIKDKRLGEAILVAPDLAPSHIDTECVDGGGINIETWTTSIVPTWIIQHFRAQSAASSWAAFGYSAGAWCSAMVSILHPDRYGAGIILGGYFTPIFQPAWSPYTAKDLPEKYHLLSWIKKHPPAISLWTEISLKDKLSGPGSQQLVRDARPPTSVTAITLTDAGHRMGVWGALIPQTLTWLGKTLPAFSPNAAPTTD